MNYKKKLYRSKSDRIISGVCGGLGKYFEVDALIVRLIFLALLFGGGSGFLIYLIFALLIPLETAQDSIPIVETVDSNSKKGKFAGKNGSRNLKLILGTILLLIGLSSLFSNFYPFQLIGRVFWPVLFITAGLVIIFKKNKYNN